MKCIDCKCELDNTNWSPSSQAKHWYVCKKCNNQRYTIYLNKFPWKRRLHNSKTYAKKANHQWLLPDWYALELMFSPCAYCGDLQEHGNGLDRIDSTKQYTKENTVSCCKRCNHAKNDMSVSEFKNHINKIYKYMKEIEK